VERALKTEGFQSCGAGNEITCSCEIPVVGSVKYVESGDGLLGSDDRMNYKQADFIYYDQRTASSVHQKTTRGRHV
jgi:hypothetical protein